MPLAKNVLYAGTPIKEDGFNRSAEIHYAFKAVDVSGTTIQVEKYGNSTVAKVGMFLMEAPATIAGTKTAVTISTIDTSNEMYDEIVLSGTIAGLTNGGTVVEANQNGAGAVVKVVPNSLQAADVYIDPDGYDFSYTAGYFSKGEVYERRIPPICDAVKDELRKTTFFRYSQSR